MVKVKSQSNNQQIYKNFKQEIKMTIEDKTSSKLCSVNQRFCSAMK